MRFLDNRRFDDDLIELPMSALLAPPFFGLPRLQNEGQGFLENFVGIRHVDTEAVGLVAAILFNDTKIEAPVGGKIQCRRPFRQQTGSCQERGITAVPGRNFVVFAARYVIRLSDAET